MSDFIEYFGKRSGFTLEGEEFRGDRTIICDFLKGWWVPSNGSFEFMPLPSRILSLGKTRTNFVHSTPARKVYQACRYAAYATSRCNAAVDHTYPILGAYLSMCSRISIPWDSDKAYKFDTMFRPEGEDPLFSGEMVSVPRDTVLDMIDMRYGPNVVANLHLLEEFCEDIDFASYEGFTVLSGFSWLSELRDRDYGQPKEVEHHLEGLFA